VKVNFCSVSCLKVKIFKAFWSKGKPFEKKWEIKQVEVGEM
jgi:hypothetical protein